MVYSDLDNDWVSKDPDDVWCPRAVWRQPVWATMPAYACALALRDWLAAEAPTMGELSCWALRAQESLSVCGTASARLPCRRRQLQPQEL